jgi:hypothetical protein
MNNRMTDERLATIERRWLCVTGADDCMACEVLQALKAERELVNAIKALPRYCYGLGDELRCVDAGELEELM